MKDLYIVGAGGCGREVLQIIKDIHRAQGPRWHIKGFLDDTEAPLAGKECDYGVVGTIQDYQPAEDDVLVMGISSPEAKQKLIPMLLGRGAQFETVIHPQVYCSDFSTIGKGSVVYPRFVMSVNVQVGDYATLLPCDLGHDVQVGSFTTICGYAYALGGVKIGNGVFIGCNSVISPHVEIGDNAYIGVGSVVIRNVKAGTHVFGNPARTI